MIKETIDEVFREHRLGPAVFAVIGPNGSGKSSAVAAMGIEDPGRGFGLDRIRIDNDSGKLLLRFVNPDDFSMRIREANPDLTQRQSDEAAVALAERKRRELADSRSDFGFETVGSHESKLQFLHDLKGLGYYIAVLFVGTEDPSINKRRVTERVSAGGHDVDPEKIEPRYKRTMGFLAQYYDIADFIAVYDNSIDIAAGGKPRLLVTKGTDGKPQTTTHCDDVRWIHTYLLDAI